MQSPGTGEVTVTWHTNRPATAAVRCTVDGGPERVFVTSRDGLIPNDSTSHAVRVTGLTPGKPFTYTLVSREFKGYRTPYEVTHVGEHRITPENVPVYNYAFDVTPAELIAGIITEKGVLTAPYEASIKAVIGGK